MRNLAQRVVSSIRCSQNTKSEKTFVLFRIVTDIIKLSVVFRVKKKLINIEMNVYHVRREDKKKVTHMKSSKV